MASRRRAAWREGRADALRRRWSGAAAEDRAMYSDDFDAKPKGKWVAFFGRVLENPDHPLGWSLRLFVFRGIDARVHLITIVVFLGLLLSSLAYDNFGVFYMAMVVASAFALVLIHEFGHAFACRRVGGQADRIVMLPWGGLALTVPPPTWKANLVTTLGGPAVHVPIFVVLAGALALVGMPGAILFNPLGNPGLVLSGISSSSTVQTYALAGLWIVHYVNVLLFCFNMALVFFPFDAGRIIQALLWAKHGYRWATSFAVHFGLAGAALLFVVALVFGNTFLVAIAAFGAIACWTERQRLQAVDEITGLAPGELDASLSYSSGLGGGPVLRPGMVEEVEEEKPSKREVKAQQRAEEHAAEIDRILAKISESGMESLTKREKRLLADETKKKQGV